MIYLASPYTHPDTHVRESRFHVACTATAKFMRRGLRVFSPIVHGHPLVCRGLPMDWSFWEPLDRTILQHCTEMYVLKLDGWQQSRGVQAEIQMARALCKPISYFEAGLVTDDKTPAGTGA